MRDSTSVRANAPPQPLGGSRSRGSMGHSVLAALLGSFAGVSAISCSDPVAVTRGVGPIVQERRTLRPVDSIDVKGGIDLSIQVGGAGLEPASSSSSGRETLVWIDAPEDLIPLVVIEVRGSTLQVRPKNGARLDPVPTIEVFTSRLSSVVADGAGEVRLVIDPAEGRTPALLSLTSEGAVDFEAKGRVAKLVVRQSGAGDMHLSDLSALVADISSSGSGDVWVQASERASVTLKGACDLYLSGLATVDEQVVLGSGKIHRSADPVDEN